MKYLSTLPLIFLLCFHGLASDRLPLNEVEEAWLDDVSVIITAKERRTFKKQLSTHEQRAEFIELFWLKRDPDLATARNEFKDDYLNRLEEAQQYEAFRGGRLNAMTMQELFLLLGKPDRRYMGLDPTIVGVRLPRIRGTYPQPESWEYQDVGYGYPSASLKVQFISTSPFGDYVAFADLRTERFLETLKQRLIVNSEITLQDRSLPSS